MAKHTLCLIAAVLVLGVTACGGSNEDSGNSSEPFANVSHTYVPSEGPAALARKSSVVIRAATGSPHEGRIWGESLKDPGASISLVFPVTVKAVEAGKLDPAVGDTVYLEMDAPAEQNGRNDRERFAKAMTDREGIFFLHRMPDRLSPYTEIVDADAGRPAGQPMYQATSPEGVLINKRDGGGIWSVEIGKDFPDASLDGFLPDRAKFPAGRISEEANPPIQGQSAP